MNSIAEDFGVALILMIVAALLGGLIVYLWLRNRIARIEERAQSQIQEAADLKSRVPALEKQVKQLEQQAKGCAAELEPLKAVLLDREKELAQARARITALEKELATARPFQEKFEDLQHRYDTLEASVLEMRAKAPAPRPEAAAPVAKAAADPKVKEELAREKALRLSFQEQLEGLKPFRQKYEELKAKYDALLAGGDEPQSRSLMAEAVAAPVVIAPAAPKPDPAPAAKPAETEEETLARIQARAQEINFARIGVATADEKDDLKIVKGIGPFIEKKLNSIGIFTFRQIAAFTEEDEEKVNDVIEFFPGRIRRDEWSSQAAELDKEKSGKKD